MSKRILMATLCFVFLAGGCATLLDPWQKAGGIDFKTQAALIGQVRLDGYDAKKWMINMSVQNLDTRKIVPLEYWRDGFITALEPGRYKISIHKLWDTRAQSYATSNYSYSSTTQSEIPIGRSSQIYTLQAGDAIYVGDLYLFLGNPGEIDMKKAWTLTGLLSGKTERPLQMVFTMQDHAGDKLSLLVEKHPVDDFHYQKIMAEFK